MHDHRNQFPIGLMCLVFCVFCSGFNSWMKRDHLQKETRKLKLVRAIEDIHRGSRKTYGSPRIFRMPKALGFQCSRSTVERLMKEFDIRSKTNSQRIRLNLRKTLQTDAFTTGWYSGRCTSGCGQDFCATKQRAF